MSLPALWLLMLALTRCSLVSRYPDPATESGPDACSNDVDDDFDGLRDCASPACAPYCAQPVDPPTAPQISCAPEWRLEPLVRHGLELARCSVPETFPDLAGDCAGRAPPFDASFVAAGAPPGGDGTPTRPYGSIDEALAAGATTLWLEPGTFTEPVYVLDDLRIEAGCDAVLGDDGDGSTPVLEVAPDATLVVVALRIEASSMPAVRLGEGATLAASTVDVGGPGTLVDAGPRSRGTIARAAIVQSGAGADVAIALGAGSYFTFSEVSIASFGPAVVAADARLRIHSSSILSGTSALVADGAVAAVDADILAARSHGGRSPVVVARHGARIALSQAVLDTDGSAVDVSGDPSEVELTDVLIHGWELGDGADAAPVITASSPGVIDGQRIAVLDPPGDVFRAAGDGAVLALSDLFVGSDPTRAAGSADVAGIAAIDGACASLTRVSLIGLPGRGLYLSGRCAHAVEHLSVVDGRLAGRDGLGEPDTLARGVYFEDGSGGTLTNFVVDHVNGCGVRVGAEEFAEVRGGAILRTTYAVCVPESTWLPQFLGAEARLVFRDNFNDYRIDHGATGNCFRGVSVGCLTRFTP